MSKYEPLWKNISENEKDRFFLSFEEAEMILGFSIDHSFLTYKKELAAFGFEVGKISIKDRTIEFLRKH